MSITGMIIVGLATGMMTAGVMAQTEQCLDRHVSDIGLTLAWDSRYVSEGRDNLDGAGLAGITAEAAFGGLSLGVWFADSPGRSYREFNAYACSHLEWRGFEAYVVYNHLRFPAEHTRDNEIGAGIAYAALPMNMSVGLDATWSFEADGAFLQACFCGEYPVFRNLTLRPSATLGFNAGYVPDGHDGANHAEIRLAAAVPVTERIELTGAIASTWGLQADPDRYPGDASLKDFVHGGIALRLSLN